MTMNELIASLAQETSLAKTQVRSVLDALSAQVGASIKAGGDVRIAGFGVFEGRRNEERDGRNPQTGAKIRIPASTSVKFRPASELKEAVKG
jgi:nucleoid DNA-binding protein